MMMMIIVALAARHKPWPCSMLNYPHDLLNLETNEMRMIPRRITTITTTKTTTAKLEDWKIFTWSYDEYKYV